MVEKYRRYVITSKEDTWGYVCSKGFISSSIEEAEIFDSFEEAEKRRMEMDEEDEYMVMGLTITYEF